MRLYLHLGDRKELVMYGVNKKHLSNMQNMSKSDFNPLEQIELLNTIRRRGIKDIMIDNRREERIRSIMKRLSVLINQI